MTTPRPPFPDDYDTVTPMTEEERLWRLERIKASLRDALENPGELISAEDFLNQLEYEELDDEHSTFGLAEDRSPYRA